ncbi:unnamed protein product [Acanthoscelides obtectus]|uniref:GRIP domain-containing protein n=2 Tax=Acanthoscelides obtectus TaxID=200917 RepID=A0A9P0JSN6_ACAOB|nr:unnamed protein product [Acanthoscelides obtectus]CAK1625480.1 Thyroid receptor-interacting protein 11 [Acanthoscelides obtectus]
MSWINFNDSLNSIKGHISTFANNVLTEDDEAQDTPSVNYKKLYEDQKQEIESLRAALQKQENQVQNDVVQEDSWDWSDDAPPTTNQNETISNLKAKITKLEKHNNDLLNQLDELDKEHQQNLVGVLAIKEKLLIKVKTLEDEVVLLRNENELVRKNEEKFKREVEETKMVVESIRNSSNYSSLVRLEGDTSENAVEDYKKEAEKLEEEVKELRKTIDALQNADTTDCISNKNVLEQNQKLKKALDDKKREVSVLNSSEETLKNVVEKYKKDTEILEKEIDTLNKTVNSLKNSSDKKSIVQENHKLKMDLEEAKKQISVLKSSEDTLQKVVEKFKQNIGESEKFLEEKQFLMNELQKAKQEIEMYEQKSLQDEKHCEKLAFILDSYEKQVRSLNDELEELKIQKRENPVMDRDLQRELDNIEEDCKDQMTSLQQELDTIVVKNEELDELRKKIDELEEQIKELTDENNNVKTDMDDLQKMHERALLELHDKYINVVTENIKKVQDTGLVDLGFDCSEKDPHINAFQKHIENIVNVLVDFRSKCETLEKETLSLTEEKNRILSDKNSEIEKLMNNSEMLSQEVIQKGKLIKDYENEISELSKNNELLINELEVLKNNRLQTISESNEDNVILLEAQLENANRRIEDLEKVIDDLEKHNKQEAPDEDTEIEVNKYKELYQEMLNTFDQMQLDHDTLKADYENMKQNFEVVEKENSDLKTNLEKLRSDYENVEYQLSEIKINGQEELELAKQKIELLLRDNENLATLNKSLVKDSEEMKYNVIVLREKLSQEQDGRKNTEMQVKQLTEKLQNYKMDETTLRLQYDTVCKELQSMTDAKNNLEASLNNVGKELEVLKTRYEELLTEREALRDKVDVSEKLLEEVKKSSQSSATETEDSVKVEESATSKEEVGDVAQLKATIDALTEDRDKLKSTYEAQLTESFARYNDLQLQFQELTNARNELVNIVTTKHNESVAYHNEIQRLTQILIQETDKSSKLEEQLKQFQNNTDESEVQKLSDQNNFLREKCEVLAKNLLDTQSKVQQLEAQKNEPSEKEITLQRNIDRLQAHLIEMEEHYTQELLQSEHKVQELTMTVKELEEREKNSSNIYTSVSIRANQQVESLQSQLQMVVTERDSLRKQVSDAEDQISKHSAALARLQFVLEQFQKDKEKDIHKETERIRRRINSEKQVQEELRKEIDCLKSQLDESKQGLLAASRLSDQLENTKKTVTLLKKEVSQLQEKLLKKEQELENIARQTDGKVDKNLVKNLVVGFISSNNNLNKDQAQILKIIATVLDFSQEDHKKLDIKQQQGSWLSSLLSPHADTHQKMSQETLSQAFIKFLETESKPREVPSLLNSADVPKQTSNNNGTPRQSPLVLNDVVLPTFTEFAQNRNSSSILKNVLKDGNN